MARTPSLQPQKVLRYAVIFGDEVDSDISVGGWRHFRVTLGNRKHRARPSKMGEGLRELILARSEHSPRILVRSENDLRIHIGAYIPNRDIADEIRIVCVTRTRTHPTSPPPFSPPSIRTPALSSAPTLKVNPLQ